MDGLECERATRQIATRARRHVDDRRPRYEASRRRRDELADRFFAAVGEGDLETLEALLAEDVELHGDGGGRVPALARALHGSRRMARTLASWIRVGALAGDFEVRRAEVNGQPGAVISDEDGVIAVWSLAGQPREARAPRPGERPEGGDRPCAARSR